MKVEVGGDMGMGLEVGVWSEIIFTITSTTIQIFKIMRMNFINLYRNAELG